MVKGHSAQYLERLINLGSSCLRWLGRLLPLIWRTTHFWQDAIVKEMDNLKTTFQIIPDGKNPPYDNQYVDYHMVFDIKMEDF